MNYILKSQLSNGLFGSFVNNVKALDSRNYICGHCLQKHTLLHKTGRELSTYVSALRLMLKRKQNQNNKNDYSEKEKLISKNFQSKKKQNKRFTELVKVTKNKSRETKMTIHQIKPSDVTAFAEEPGMTFGSINNKNKCSYDSSRTYDPNLLIPRDVIVKFDINEFCTTVKKSNAKSSLKKPSIKASTIRSHSSNNLKNSTSNYLYNYYLSLKTKSVSNHKKPKLKKFKNENDHLDILKSLPFSSVEIFPMPRSLQQNISKKSERAIKELTKPNIKKAQVLTKPEDELKLHVLAPVIEKEQARADVEEEYTPLKVRDFEKIQINISSKEYALAQLIQSYVDVAVNNDMVAEGLKMLNSCRRKEMWKNTVKKTGVVDVYNILIHSYSQQGNWLTVNKITDWMKLDGVQFNSQTYAGILDCLGRVNKNVFQTENAWMEEVVKNLKDIYKNKLSLNELFTETTLTKDKQDKILETIRKVLPYFEIEPTKTKLSSNCSLLKDLNKGYNILQSPVGNDFMIETIEKLVEEQLLLEKNFSIQVKSVAYGNTTSASNMRKFEALNTKWREMITNGFEKNLKTAKLEHAKFSDRFNLYVYLNCLPAEGFVDVMMDTVRTLVEYSGGYSPNTALLHKILGNKIYQRYQTKKKIDTGVMDRTEKLFKKYCAWFLDPVGPATNSRQEWQMLIQDFQDGCLLDTKEIKWPEPVKTCLGKYLYDIILKEVKISVGEMEGKERLVPVFYQILRYKGVKCNEEIKCHPAVSKLFKKVGYENLYFDAFQIPMVCPPKPWKAVDHGGYLILPTEFIRRPQEICGKMTDFKKVPVQQLYSTFDSLNALQSVPWVVNENVLDVILEVFQNGGSDELNVPKLPEDDPVPLNMYPEMSSEERQEEFKKRQKIVRERQNQYGLWCEALYRLSLANHFRKRVFWFPQNFDFRGRVYPVPPHLNHLGADLFRSLLLFAKGKPLGPNGLDWIKIHTINLTGTHKKKSVRERLAHANNILPEILDSAERPLTGKKWWMQSDEPWQTLAACMEIKQILSSPDPESFISKFPIHQDGSCNGLQHYAALGRDMVGAKSVNLSPSEEPQDVYSVVTQIIEEKRLKDAEEGVEIARILGGFIRRKVVKQTIMTTVYGVTKYGARLQIAGQLEDINDFPNEHVWKAAGYLVTKTFESLQQMFTSAKEIQDWFIKCSVEICKKKDYVQWVSPMGLPILQPYAKLLSKNQRAKVNCTTLPNVMKQKNAFPPNFVHSLDSCHMMLTALFCEQSGLTFASIHDCFWTHPSTVHLMNKICREQFVSLHSQPILEDLSKFFTEYYIRGKEDEEKTEASKTFKAVPKTGDFDLNSVLNSVYFFS